MSAFSMILRCCFPNCDVNGTSTKVGQCGLQQFTFDGDFNQSLNNVKPIKEFPVAHSVLQFQLKFVDGPMELAAAHVW